MAQSTPVVATTPPVPEPTATRATPAPRPTAAPVAPSGPGAAALAGSQAEAARGKLGGGQYRDAAQTFEQAVGRARGYSLQLEIVCQDSSVREGFGQASGRSEYFILPFTYRGRPCYRVLWGVYDSRAEAQRAAAGVPAFFRSQLRGRPVPVVSVSGVR